jgi:hypothetical protein
MQVSHCIVCLNPDRCRPFDMVIPSDPLDPDLAAYGRVIQHEAVSLTMEVSKSFEGLLQQVDQLVHAIAAPGDSRGTPKGPPPSSPMRTGRNSRAPSAANSAVHLPDVARAAVADGGGGGGGVPGGHSMPLDPTRAALAVTIADWDEHLCESRDELLELARAVAATVASVRHL